MDLLSKFKKEKKESKIKSKNSIPEDPMTMYCHIVYSIFGKFLLDRKQFKDFFTKTVYNKKYETVLKQANLRLLPEEYFVSVFLTIVFVLIFVVFSSIVLFVVGSPFAVISFYGGVGAIFMSGLFMYNYPVLTAKTRGSEIDASLPYLMPYLKILAKELTLSKIIDIIDDFLIYKEIKVEFQRIKYYSQFLGYDVHSSIREAMLSCPSKQLSDLMNDLVTISNSGGDIYKYLDRKLYNLNAEIDAIEKKNIDTLLIYSQVYVVILLIAPLFYTIMNAILNLIEFSSNPNNASLGAGGGVSMGSILILLFFLPFVYVGFMMLVFYSKPLYSRLKPMESLK